jgi:hypothetical protein
LSTSSTSLPWTSAYFFSSQEKEKEKKKKKRKAESS